MITARSYDARIAWLYSGLGDNSDYPGKIRALAAAFADRAAISCYRAARFYGLPGLLAELLTVALWAVFPVLLAPAAVGVPANDTEWPPAWTPRRSRDRLTSRRTTGPPCPARPMTPGGFRALTSP